MESTIKTLVERRREGSEKEEKFGVLYSLEGKYVTIEIDVGGKIVKTTGRIVGYDAEYFILTNSGRKGSRVFVPKNFYEGFEIANVVDDIEDNVGRKLDIVCVNEGIEGVFTGILRNSDDQYLFLEENGKLKPVPKKNVVDWCSERDLGTIDKCGF